MLSGKIVVCVGVFILLTMLGSSLWVSIYHKGLAHNYQEEQKANRIKAQLEKMQTCILEHISTGKPVTIKDFSALCGDYEFLYLPNNYNDMRKTLIVCRQEIIVQLKDFDGNLLKNPGSLGFVAIMGGDFRIKDISTKDLLLLEKDWLRDNPQQLQAKEIDPLFIEKQANKVFALPAP